MFSGPLTASMNIDWSPGGNIFARQSPNLFWPQDRSWCVASEIDLHATFVGGSLALANALVATPVLEAWRVEPTDPITATALICQSESTDTNVFYCLADCMREGSACSATVVRRDRPLTISVTFLAYDTFRFLRSPPGVWRALKQIELMLVTWVYPRIKIAK